MNFSAVILAGGKSSRMGRDKATLTLAGETLLERQIKLVRAVGATEVLISGGAGRDYSRFGGPVLTDHFPHAGPLAGIQSALQMCRHQLLLVLAVDMPNMTATALKELIEQSDGQIGVIPRLAGRAEPLAAIYPKLAAAQATTLLQSTPPGAAVFISPGAGTLAAKCVRSGWAGYHDLPVSYGPCFKSWNEPQDVVLV